MRLLHLHIYLPFLCLILSLTCLWTCKQAASPEQDLQQLWEEYQAFQDFQDSLRKTAWPVYSDSVLAVERHLQEGWLARLDDLSTDKLSEANHINHELLRLLIADRVFQLSYQSHLMPLNSEGGFVSGILYSLQHAPMETAIDKDRYIQKLQTLPAYLDQQIQLMRRGLESGKTMPKLIIRKSLDIIRSFAETSASESVFLTAARKDPKVYQQLLPLVKQDIIPAYQELITFLEQEYLPTTRVSIGASALPEGKTYYEQRVRFFTTLDISPEEVFDIGQKEVARIRGHMEEIIRQQEFQGSFDEFLHFLRTDPQFYANSPEELLQHAAWQAKRAEAFLPTYFGHFPRMPFTVEPVPAAIAPNYTGGRYSEGSYDTHKPGAFWVNTYKLETRPLYVLPALTLHEAVPGHHLQIMLSQEQENVPKFRQDQYLSAFGEGWALYAEYLGKEAGMYETPYEDFGRLTYEMWRACRLVVDVGMHAKGWSRQQAVDFMASNTALSLHEVNTEIDRYIGWPAQAVSYKMGEITIRQLRQEAEERLGESFDIRAFHDLILSNGSIPMQSLKRVVHQYLDKY
ncbi:MAG: DUF885 domain-containing protein [Bacteroidota bacterium]